MSMQPATRDFTGSLRPQSGPETRFIVFSTKSVVNRAKSKESGRPVHEAKTFIKIQNPGDNLHVLERLATDQDVADFPMQWKAFQEGREAIPDGTSLTVLFPQNPEIVDNLRQFKIFTIEQLAGLTDTQKQSIGMGGMKMSQDATAYLKAAQSGADFHKLRGDVDRMMNETKAKDARITALEAELKRREEADKARHAGPPATQPRAQQQPQR